MMTMKITQVSETEIKISEIEERNLFFQLIGEIEACYSFWKYMRGRNGEV